MNMAPYLSLSRIFPSKYLVHLGLHLLGQWVPYLSLIKCLVTRVLAPPPPPQVCVGVDPTTGAGRQESQPITSNVCAAECLGFGFIFEKISSAWMFIVGVGFYFPTSKGDFFICFAAWCFVVGFVWLWSNEMRKCRKFNFSLWREADRRGNPNCAKCR